jgi:predicted transcriptional regulator
MAMRINRRRSNIEIIADMLRVGENGAGKTEIMYSANMSYTQIQKYLRFLMDQNLVCRVEMGNPIVTYQVTEKGLKLLRSIDNIINMLGLASWNEAEGLTLLAGKFQTDEEPTPGEAVGERARCQKRECSSLTRNY